MEISKSFPNCPFEGCTYKSKYKRNKTIHYAVKHGLLKKYILEKMKYNSPSTINQHQGDIENHKTEEKIQFYDYSLRKLDKKCHIFKYFKDQIEKFIGSTPNCPFKNCTYIAKNRSLERNGGSKNAYENSLKRILILHYAAIHGVPKKNLPQTNELIKICKKMEKNKKIQIPLKGKNLRPIILLSEKIKTGNQIRSRLRIRKKNKKTVRKYSQNTRKNLEKNKNSIVRKKSPINSQEENSLDKFSTQKCELCEFIYLQTNNKKEERNIHFFEHFKNEIENTIGDEVLQYLPRCPFENCKFEFDEKKLRNSPNANYCLHYAVKHGVLEAYILDEIQQRKNQFHENFREIHFTKKIVENSGKKFSITKLVHEETKFDNFILEPELYDEMIKCQKCQWSYIAPFSNFCITCLDECIRISVSEYGTIFICTLCEIEPEEYCDRSEINSHIGNVHFAYDG